MRPSKLRLPDSTERDREVALVDRRGDLVRQRAGVADARRAAVADEVEAERLEVLGEAGALVVLGDDLRARRQRRLDPRRARQALGDRVARQQAGGEHDRRVGGVGAGGDRGDHDVAVVERRRSRRRASSTTADARALRDRGAALGAGGRRVARARPASLPGAPSAGGSRRREASRRPPRRGRGRARGRRRRRSARPATRGSPPWRRSARRGPAGASGRPATARPSTGRARAMSVNVGSSAFSSCQRPCALA